MGCSVGFKLKTCPEIDLNDGESTKALYQDYLDTDVDQSTLYYQASQELDFRLIEEFGSNDYLNALNVISASPADFVDGRWGFSHATLTIGKLEILRLSGATNSEIESKSFDELSYWYSREAIARCSDEITNWENPLNWGEDSRLDYMTPFLFVEWYISQL
ncbi:hypothetical protein N9043_00710 [bacterium]|nr:hypothetical protein [bacterium]